ncbi:MAG: DUF5004 domain-containing protein [Bacteroidia bacterium]|nr:DUF5004 domain-containing protein [Bacteroidia bacterium]
MYKKKALTLLIPVLAILLLFYTSCDKNSDTAYLYKLTGTTWKLYDFMRESDTSLFKYLDTCIKDNSIRYFADGTFTENEGKFKCDPTDPIEQRGTWSFNSEMTQLNTTDNKGIKTIFDIIKLERDQLKLRYTDTADTKFLLYFNPYLD